MSTFPPPCPDGSVPDMSYVRRCVSDNESAINTVRNACVCHFNEQMRDNQLAINECERRLRKTVSSEIVSMRRTIDNVGSRIAEVIAHGVADISVAGNSAIGNIDLAIADADNALPDTTSPPAHDTSSQSGDITPGVYDGGASGANISGAAVSLPGMSAQAGTSAEYQSAANDVTVQGLGAATIGPVTINLHIHVAKLVIVTRSEQVVAPSATEPAPPSSMLDGLQGGRGGGDDGFSIPSPISTDVGDTDTTEYPPYQDTPIAYDTIPVQDI